MKKALMMLAMWVLGAGSALAESGLPTGYVAVDCIVAQAGRYVDTGYRPNQNTRVVMDVTVQGAGEYWFGCWDRGYKDGAFAFGNDGSGIYAGYGDQGGTFGSVVANGHHTVELDKNVVKVDGAQKYPFDVSSSSFTLANNLYLFAQNRAGVVVAHGSQTSIVCHGCKIYDNGELVREFVPCAAPSGKIGLYDKVERRFYTLRMNLPTGYAAVDAIVAPRGAYIDTDYKPNQNTRVAIDVTVQGAREYWFGAWNVAWNDGAYALGNDNGEVYCGYGSGSSCGGIKVNNNGLPTGRVTVALEKGVVYTNDVVWSDAHRSDAEFTVNYNLYLFAQNRKGTATPGDGQVDITCHGCKIYEGSKVKRNFVPCVRMEDAVAGLYDTVEGKFYENAGTGNFCTPDTVLPFGRTLVSGTYEITDPFAFVAPVLESALKVAEGATVTLDIASGIIVAVRGGDAFEVWGGGAGIEVPANAKLNITGEGKLVAHGGKGANGCNGVNGGNGSADESGNFTSGVGGAGGWGGGGAGAGIGGKGASGGGGGNGGKSVSSYNWEYEDLNGQAGDNGGPGKNGGSCGTISITGSVTVFVYGGTAGAANGGGGGCGVSAIKKGTSYYFSGKGGGGGGSGAKGGAAQDIGGGGEGGYGGGGGGSGGYVWGTSDTVYAWPGCGAGGHGAWDGVSGEGGSAYGGAGGAKGAAGAPGGNGSLSVSEFAVVVSSSGKFDSYYVGRISGTTKYIRWEYNHLYCIEDGERTELPYSVVDANTSSFDDGKWYVVKGTVSRGNIYVNGTANLVLLHDSSLTASGEDKEAGILVPFTKAFNIFGVESGSLTATGGLWGAGIGGDSKTNNPNGGTITINGGTVTANGGDYAAGIGGGSLGAGGNVTINGGTVTATGGKYCAGIGGGHNNEGSSGSLTLGPRVLKIDDSHYQEGVTVSFEMPSGLQLVGVRTDVGPVKTTENESSCIAVILPGQRLTLTFAAAGFEHRLMGNAEVTVGPVSSDIAIDASQLPQAEAVARESADYILADGETATAENACPLYSTAATMAMGQGGWYIVRGEVTTAAIEVRGEANLILSDGATLTVNGGIGVDEGATLNIYGQEAGTGKLIANGAENCAGIGGRNPDGQDGRGNCGTVTISGGEITATGGKNCAGIGGGYKGAGGTVTLGANMSVIEGEVGNGSGYVKIVEKTFVTVTVGEYANMTAAWTIGNGGEMNTIEGNFFKVEEGTENIKVIFTPVHNYRFKDNGETGIRTLPSPIDDDSSVTPPEVEGIPGTVARPWNVGEGVTAYVSDEKTLVVGGTGAMTDFASAAAVPWHEDAGAITAVTIAEGVTKVGKNALAALADTVTVNGTPLLTYRSITTINGMTLEEFNAKNRFLNLGSEMQIVAKAEIAAAEAEAVKVAENKVKLRVSVAKSNNPEAVSWSKATIEGATVETDGEVTLTVPADFANGYMILKTKDAESTGDGVKSAQTVGMLSVQNSAKQAAVGVPFGRLEGWKVGGLESGDLTVEDVLGAMELAEGDIINVYDREKSAYQAWEWKNGGWSGVKTVTAEGTTEPPEARTVSLPRGSTFWLERKNTANPIILAGRYVAGEATAPQPVIEPGSSEQKAWNLVANPKGESFDLNAVVKGDIGAKDQILVPTEGAPVIYTYEGGAWGCMVNEKVDLGGGLIVISPKRSTAAERTTIPAGRGFWYISAGGTPTFKW